MKTVRTPFETLQGVHDQAKIDQLYASKVAHEKEIEKKPSGELIHSNHHGGRHVIGGARRMRRFMDKLEPWFFKIFFK